MHNRIQHIAVLIIAFIGLLSPTAIHARTALITSASQLSSHTDSGAGSLSNLLDGSSSTSWHSSETASQDADIEIDLKQTFSLSDGEDIVIEILRCKEHDNEQPVAFRLEAAGPDGAFVTKALPFFLFRGKGTREYSERIHFDGEFSKLRLVVTDTKTRTLGKSGHKVMGIAGLQIYTLARKEPYSSQQLDPIHLTSDYRYDFHDAEFENTPGILHEANRQYSDNARDWCDWSKWSNGKWTEDSEVLSEAKIEMPDFSMLSRATPGGATSITRLLEPGQLRQPTHTTEHVVYALPGEPIALYPYYEMQRYAHSNYLVKFSHWYDWKTGGHITATNSLGEEQRLLDFAIDPSGILFSDQHGYFGGPGLGVRRFQNHFLIYTPAEYIAFANLVNSGHPAYTAEIMADLDFSGYGNVPTIGFNSQRAYQGKIDGHNHRISNLTITLDNGNGCGIIGRANGCEIRNLIIDNTCTFTAPQKVGALVGIAVSEGGLDGNGNMKTPLIISNVDSRATVVFTTKDAWGVGGLVGYNNGSSGKMDSNIVISDSHIGGKIYGPDGSKTRYSAIGLIGKFALACQPEIRLTNVYIDPELLSDRNNASRYAFEFEFEADAVYTSAGTTKWNVLNAHCISTNCWRSGTVGYPNSDDFNFKRYLSGSTDSSDFLSKIGSGFELRDGLLYPKYHAGMTFNIISEPLPDEKSLHGFPMADFGTIATFYYPRDPNTTDGSVQSLPEEYVIAADFSQSFISDANISLTNTGADKIIEPIIQYRHIFRVKDGAAFAEEFSGSADRNKDYIASRKVQVGARQGNKFQVRLDAPVPATIGTPSRFYYKTNDADYRRVCTMNIRVLDGDTGRDITSELTGDSQFRFTEQFSGMGSRTIDGITYSICGGGGEYYRMLSCEKPSEKYPRVRVLILGNDIEGNPISVCGSEGTPLVVMEYDIEFMSTKAASFLTERELYNNPENERFRPSYLQKQPNLRLEDRVDFDEYRALEALSNSRTAGNSNYLMTGDEGKYWVKWPLPWNDSSYAFGYDKATAKNHTDHFDYNEYMIANHSDMTPYHAAASRFPFSDEDQGRQTGGGLFDRLYYETEREGRFDPSIPREKGYFYYVNAATDPGVMSRLEVGQLCDGSTVHVSAWMSEFSMATIYQTPEQLEQNGIIPGETANIAFNFVAVLGRQAGSRQGERVKLHSFVTGYVPYDDDHYGHWMHVYYSFTPRLSDSHLLGLIEHFELELDNNCKNSEGADYAIDDIMLFVENPTVDARQLDGLCDTDQTSVKVKIETKFDTFMEALQLPPGTPDENETIQLFYTFIDKETFDANNDPDTPGAGELAYFGDGSEENPGAVLTYDYNGSGEATTYGTLLLNSCFELNDPYDISDSPSGIARRLIDADGVRKIAFNSAPEDSKLTPNREYYIAIKAVEGSDPYYPIWDDFDLNSPCTMQCHFTVYPASVKKIDGRLVAPDEDVTCCENMHPVVQIVLNGYNETTGEVEVARRNATVDWYAGSLEEYYAERTAGGATLEEALAKLRDTDNHASSLDGIEPSDAGLTQDMIELLRQLTEPSDGHLPRLRLYRNSYIFPSLLAKGEEREVSVTAIPIETIVEGYRICSQPLQVKVKVVGKSPMMTHGFSSGINYPDDMEDVPLRASWQQLHDVTFEPRSATGADEAVKLHVPIRKMTMSGVTDCRNMRKRTLADGSADVEINLVWTDDPEYTDLGSPDITGKEVSLLAVGEITGIDATLDDGDIDSFTCAFYNYFKMKEGYTYSFRYPFEEASDEADKNCPGQDVFTVKVVPEFLKWTGASGSNFNSDTNWRRIDSSEIYATDATRAAKPQSFTNLDNPTSNAFAPLDFTRVIIPGDAEVQPHLFEIAKSDVSPIEGSAVATLEWSVNPAERVERDFSEYAYQFQPGAPTPRIQFDMAAFYTDIEEHDGVYCRPWYANTCREIHFMPASQMIGQRELIYEKAWVDIELSPLKWHCVASPLKEVFAGDLYLPTKGARQESQYFTDIKFDESLHNRFAPAVYQRGWNRSHAIVYEYEPRHSRNVAVKAGWSNVFNDVREQYGAGTGFAIKADPSDAIGCREGESVLFRLPKADTSFLYYDKPTGGKNDSTAVRRTPDSFRLNDANGEVKAEAAEGNRFFLIGNPLMSHLDMEKFLKANSDKILPKYWTAGDGRQQAGIFDEEGTKHLGDGPMSIPPLESFFVEAREGASILLQPSAEIPYARMQLSLRYDDSMASIGTSSTQDDTRAETITPIRLTALLNDTPTAQAIIRIDADATEGFIPERDIELLDFSEALEIPMLPFAVAGGRASVVSTRSGIDGAELGAFIGCHTDRHNLQLRLDGIPEAEGYLLHDLDADTYTPIFDGIIIDINSDAPRFRICKRPDATGLEGISLQLDGRCATLSTSRASILNVEATDAKGIVCTRVEAFRSVSFEIEPGLHIIKASDGTDTRVFKIIVK